MRKIFLTFFVSGLMVCDRVNGATKNVVKICRYHF
nr:MAG TPA: hypothetical protein [Caudoviricetes sp.]